MAYPEFSPQDIADYSGRPVSSYSEFTYEALKQARALFKFATCIKDWPTDPDDAELAQYAILSMADQLVLAQPHAKVMANPFTSESLGSYSYSKATQQIRSGLPTGVTWFDMAVERLGVCDVGAGVYSGSIGVFEHDDQILPDADGKPFVVGPRNRNNSAVAPDIYGR